MGKAIRASVVVLLLVCSAQAGIIQNGSPEPPPPQPQSTGIIQNGEPAPQSDGVMVNGSPQSVQETPAETSLLVQIALNLLTLL